MNSNADPAQSKPVEAEPQGYYTKRTTGADGKPIPSYWMPTLPPRQTRDMGRKVREYQEKKTKTEEE